jgi:hypothetical protein
MRKRCKHERKTCKKSKRIKKQAGTKGFSTGSDLKNVENRGTSSGKLPLRRGQEP